MVTHFMPSEKLLFDPDSVSMLARFSTKIFLKAATGPDEIVYLESRRAYLWPFWYHFFRSKHRLFPGCIRRLFETYGKLYDAKSTSREIIGLQETLRFCWFCIMKDLKSLRLRPRHTMYSFFCDWRGIGRKLGIRNDDRPPDPDETKHTICAWTECLCHKGNPCRHRLRICTGCFIVMYCGERCQTL